MKTNTINGRKVVWGEGPSKPKLILVGESLGEHEEEEGRPFVGTDGKILDGILTSARIKREDCYITNVVKIRPPDNKVERISEFGLRVEDFIPMLRKELEAVDCSVIVALGDLSLNVLTGKDGITKHRGSIYYSTLLPSRLCIPTLHPGYVREFWQSRGTVVEDFKKADRIAREGYREVKFNTLISPTLPEAEAFIRDLLRLDKFSFDIEVFSAASNQIACLGLGGESNGIRRSICIPFKYKYIPEAGYTNYWKREEEIYLWTLIKELFDSDLLKIGQYISYDFHFLFPIIGEPAPPWFDIMAAHHLIDPELPHDLAYLTSIYTDVPYYKDDPKDEGKGWSSLTPSERLWIYNGKDVEIPLMLHPILTKELETLGLLDIYEGYVMPLVRAMWRIERRGMLIENGYREILSQEAKDRLTALQKEMEEKVGFSLNPNSPKQMMDFLYNRLKLPVQYHRKTRKPTADKETLNKLFSRYPNPIFKLALDIRDVNKDIGTYLDAQISPDGRARGRYNVCGTETGRSSCSKFYDGTGMDMQNVPRSENGKPDIRRVFIAPEGKVLISYDLWQAEAYCVAAFSGSRVFLDRLKQGKKIHTLVASWVFGKPEEEVSSEEYSLAKRLVHAANYGLGPNLFSVLARCTVARAKELLGIYRKYAPEISQWHREIQMELEKTRKLITPFGRIRFFRNRFGDEMFREAYAHLPQSTIADYLHQALVKFEYSYFKGAQIVQEGFDSMVIECDEGLEEEVDRLISKCFDKTLYWKSIEFKIPYEKKTGKTWN